MADDPASEFRRGAEAMREAVLAIVRPLGEYSDTPEMQAILRLRCECEALIHQITVDWLDVVDWGRVRRQRMLRGIVEPPPKRCQAMEERMSALEARFGALEARIGGLEESIHDIGLLLKYQGELLAKLAGDDDE